MMAIVSGTGRQWCELQGNFGEFTPPGTQVSVQYILTSASLSDEGTGSSILSNYLLPVRELFTKEELNFEELMQRDIDDYRVATDIIPYLVQSGPLARFLPPILAVIVPNKSELYPAVSDKAQQPVSDGMVETTTTYGSCMELVRYHEKKIEITQGKLRFNPEKSKLVVIDGQHRAMAILAIKRTKSNKWGDTGRDYKHFYEDLASVIKTDANLDKVDLPVCICVFPDLVEGSSLGYSVTQVCRKLFLDVNRTARRPTRARTLLLDDSNLIAVLVRQLLGKVRHTSASVLDKFALTIDAFEYDSPREAPVPRRELALCSVEMLYEIIYWALFAEDSCYGLKKRQFSGRRPKPQKTRFLKEIRAAENVKTEEFQSWGIANLETELNPESTPVLAHGKLSELFMQDWGAAIAAMFTGLHPFKVHLGAVADLRAAHMSDDGHGALAYKALFDGQGIFWTVEAQARHRKEARAKGVALPVAQIENAYDSAQRWVAEEFQYSRARAFWMVGPSKPLEDEMVRCVISSYKTFRTQAFQVGFVMALAYIKKELSLNSSEHFLRTVSEVIRAWNAVFCRDSTPKSKSLATFDRASDHTSLLKIHPPAMNPTHWVHFRYFVLEFLAASKVEYSFSASVRSAAQAGRAHYLAFLTDYYNKSEAKLGTTKLETEKRVRQSLQEALKNAVGLTKSDFEAWHKSVPANSGGETPVDSLNVGEEVEPDPYFSEEAASSDFDDLVTSE